MAYLYKYFLMNSREISLPNPITGLLLNEPFQLPDSIDMLLTMWLHINKHNMFILTYVLTYSLFLHSR